MTSWPYGTQSIAIANKSSSINYGSISFLQLPFTTTLTSLLSSGSSKGITLANFAILKAQWRFFKTSTVTISSLMLFDVLFSQVVLTRRRLNFLKFFRYVNHTFIQQSLDKVIKTLNNEDRNQYLLPFPNWIARFTPICTWPLKIYCQRLAKTIASSGIDLSN